MSIGRMYVDMTLSCCPQNGIKSCPLENVSTKIYILKPEEA